MAQFCGRVAARLLLRQTTSCLVVNTRPFARPRPLLSVGGTRLFCSPAADQPRLFIQTATTPNPESLKFIPGCDVLPADFGSSADFRTLDSARSSPLARRLFMVDGVQGVFLGSDFVSITKAPHLTWAQLRPFIFEALMDFFSSGKPVVTEAADGATDQDALDDDDEVVMLIKEILETRIRPSVHEDGGDIFFKGWDAESGVVQLQLAGACAGCPSSTVTLKSGVENMLCHYIPEVKRVEQVGDESDSDVRVLSWKTDDDLPH